MLTVIKFNRSGTGVNYKLTSDSRRERLNLSDLIDSLQAAADAEEQSLFGRLIDAIMSVVETPSEQVAPAMVTHRHRI